MTKEFNRGDTCDCIVAPLGSQCTNELIAAADILHVAGIDVRLDMRMIKFHDKKADWENSGARCALISNDFTIRDGLASVFSLCEDVDAYNDIPLRRAMDAILGSEGLPPVPKDVRLPTEPAPAPISPSTPAPEAKAEAPSIAPDIPADAGKKLKEAEPVYPSWDVDDGSWVRELTPANAERLKKTKAEWKLPGNRCFAVIYGDRVYLKAAHIPRPATHTNSNSFRSNIGIKLRKGATEYNGVRIGYADPAIEAIRVGKTREEFAAQFADGRKTEIASGKSTQGSVLDDMPVKAAAKPAPMKAMISAAREVAKAAPAPDAPEAVAMIVMGEDGKLQFDRDFTAEQAAQVIEFCKGVAAKSARVSL